jgi:hypothetical protein
MTYLTEAERLADPLYYTVREVTKRAAERDAQRLSLLLECDATHDMVVEMNELFGWNESGIVRALKLRKVLRGYSNRVHLVRAILAR